MTGDPKKNASPSLEIERQDCLKKSRALNHPGLALFRCIL